MPSEQAFVLTMPYVLDADLPGYVDPSFVTFDHNTASCDRCGVMVVATDHWLTLHIAYHRELIKAMASIQRGGTPRVLS